MTKTDTIITNEEEDDDDDVGFYDAPAFYSQVPLLNSHGEQRDTGGNDDQEAEVEEGPKTRTNTWGPELQQYTTNQEAEEQIDDTQPDARPLEETVHSGVSDDHTEQEQNLQKREQHAPKKFTYDQLGTPTCYCTVDAYERYHQYHPLAYGHIQPVWVNPFQVCQPLFIPS